MKTTTLCILLLTSSCLFVQAAHPIDEPLALSAATRLSMLEAEYDDAQAEDLTPLQRLRMLETIRDDLVSLGDEFADELAADVQLDARHNDLVDRVAKQIERERAKLPLLRRWFERAKEHKGKIALTAAAAVAALVAYRAMQRKKEPVRDPKVADPEHEGEGVPIVDPQEDKPVRDLGLEGVVFDISTEQAEAAIGSVPKLIQEVQALSLQEELIPVTVGFSQRDSFEGVPFEVLGVSKTVADQMGDVRGEVPVTLLGGKGSFALVFPFLSFLYGKGISVDTELEGKELEAIKEHLEQEKITEDYGRFEVLAALAMVNYLALPQFILEHIAQRYAQLYADGKVSKELKQEDFEYDDVLDLDERARLISALRTQKKVAPQLRRLIRGVYYDITYNITIDDLPSDFDDQPLHSLLREDRLILSEPFSYKDWIALKDTVEKAPSLTPDNVAAVLNKMSDLGASSYLLEAVARWYVSNVTGRSKRIRDFGWDHLEADRSYYENRLSVSPQDSRLDKLWNQMTEDEKNLKNANLSKDDPTVIYPHLRDAIRRQAFLYRLVPQMEWTTQYTSQSESDLMLDRVNFTFVPKDHFWMLPEPEGSEGERLRDELDTLKSEGTEISNPQEYLLNWFRNLPKRVE